MIENSHSVLFEFVRLPNNQHYRLIVWQYDDTHTDFPLFVTDIFESHNLKYIVQMGIISYPNSQILIKPRDFTQTIKGMKKFGSTWGIVPEKKKGSSAKKIVTLILYTIQEYLNI